MNKIRLFVSIASLSLVLSACNNQESKKHQHDWDTPTYVWADDYLSCTATRVCKKDSSHIETETRGAVMTTVTPAGCGVDGLGRYVVTFDNRAFETQYHEYTIPGHGHSWDSPTYELIGNSQMTAKRECLFDSSHIEEETVDGEYSVITPATLDDEGLGRYTFTFTNPAFETQTNDVVIDRLTNDGSVPVFSEDGKTVTYGIYPQTHITDSDLILELEQDADWLDSGYYKYNDEYYAKVYCNPYSENYKFDDGSTINKYSNYWFKYEPITWTILSSGNDRYLLLSNVLLDAYQYSSSNNNNYKDSSIRDWLNDEFYSRAFALENKYIINTTVNNSASTTASSTNQYACDNTQDNVFLLSFKEYTNSNYGFANSDTASSSTRYCKTTDYARARGACISTSYSTLNNGHYWTRSPNSGNKNYAAYVLTDGVIGFDNNTSYAYLCARPAILITTTVE